MDQQGTKYSMYQPGLLGLLGTCYCVNNDPRGNYVLSGEFSFLLWQVRIR
jgi:hypothetical protein